MNRQALAALAAGVVFGLGLAMSGMTDPERVLGFLDVFGTFDPALLFVLGGAVLTTLLLFGLVLKQGRPVLASAFQLPTRKDIDGKLLAGAALFGAGWGVAGSGPGPALAGLGVLSSEALWFVPAMLVGMVVHRWMSGS